MKALAIGAHLVSDRGLYQHHGIYAGDGKVIHYAGLADGLSSGPVEYTTVKSFCAGKSLSVRQHTNPRYIGNKVVERAVSRLGESRYDVHANNCEHFCVWAVSGRTRSGQTDKVEAFVDVFIPTAAKLLRARKHVKQKGGSGDVGGDIAETAALAAACVAFPVAIAPVAIYKVMKWLFK